MFIVLIRIHSKFIFMKTISLIASLLLFLTATAQENSRTIPSTISQVMVFSQGAQVQRTATAKIEQGKSEIIFSGISPNIDIQSLRVKGKGKFTILNVICQSNYLNSQKSRQEINVLKSKKNQLSESKQLKTNTQNVINNEIGILSKNQSIAGVNIGLKMLDLKEAVDFHKSRMTENYKILNDLGKEIYTIDTTIVAIDRQLEALNNSDVSHTNDAIVTIKANESIAKAELEISYYVTNAGWYADYDLRVKDVVSPMQWTFKANVFQQSGEDWKNVKMAISNGNPTENGVAPQITPWYLAFATNPMVYKMQSNLQEAVVVGYGKRAKLSAAPSPVVAEDAMIPLETSVVYQPTSIVYEIKEPMTVLNDNKKYKTEIKTFEVPAQFEYVAVPKLDKSVYLNAKVINWQELNLFDGEINLFFEDEFHGKSYLNLTQAKDTLDISLGKDKSIVVERKPIKNFTSKQFLSSYKTESKAFEIVIRNNKSVPVNMQVYDQFPISTNKEIEVEELVHPEGTLDQDSKIITWKLNLVPKVEKKLELKYQVKYPKNKVVQLE